MSILIGILILILLLFLLIYPVVLLIRCIFDHQVSGSAKLLVVLSSFFAFPLPSYCYGAFIRGGLFSKIMVGINILVLIAAIAAYVFIGGAAIMEKIDELRSRAESGSLISQTTHILPLTQEPVQEEKPQVYKGYNTYERDEINVFTSEKPKKGENQ
ncbi:MAG: hypothetical protein ACPGRX_06085 [Bdellovibrionales bacterium]